MGFILSHWHHLTLLDMLSTVAIGSAAGIATIVLDPRLKTRTVVIDDLQLVVLAGSRQAPVERVDIADIRDIVTTGAARSDRSVVLRLTGERIVKVLTRINDDEARAVRDAIRDCLALPQGP